MEVFEHIDSLLREEVTSLVGDDIIETNHGWVAGLNEDFRLGPKYLCAFNYPTQIDQIDYISQFAGDADIDFVQRFYRSTNGLRFFGTGFFIPGVRLHPETMVDLDFFNCPTGVEVTSGFHFPEYSPETGFVIGHCHIWKDGETVLRPEVLTAHGSIISGCFHEAPHILEEFNDLEEWLINRTRQAHREFSAAKRRRMN